MRGIFVFLWNVSVSLSSVSMDDFRNACEELAEIIIIAVSNKRRQWSSIFTAHDRFLDY